MREFEAARESGGEFTDVRSLDLGGKTSKDPPLKNPNNLLMVVQK
jgi:hypothetical protein